MSYNYIDSLSTEARERYNLKLSTIGVSNCVYKLPADTWVDDPTQWPDIQNTDVVIYLTHTAGIYTMEAMKNYKSLEAYHYFKANFVGAVKHFRSPNTSVVFRAPVRPSQRSNDKSHQPWVATDKDGKVIAGHCTCMAGLGESCSHVAALLFKVEYANRIGLTTDTCTSKPCEWNNFYREKVKPARISQIQFYKDESKSKIQVTDRKRRKTSHIPPADESMQQSFLESIADETPKPVALSLFGETAHHFRCTREVQSEIRLPQPLRRLYIGKDLTDHELEKKADDVIKKLNVTNDQNKFLEQQTRGQGQSVVWREQRPGHISASNAHSVLRTDPTKPAPSVVTGVTKPMHDIPVQSPSLVYGRENEHVASSFFEGNVKMKHKNGQLLKTGMQISKEHPWLSATADGIVHCDCHGKFTVEIKCPYTARDTTCQQFMADNSSYLHKGSLKYDHAYYTQVQIQMLVYNVKQCAFVVKLKDGYIICTIPKNMQFLDNIIPKLKTFWKQHIVKELLTRKLENFSKPVAPPCDTRLYCYCKQLVSNQLMIGCDGINCPYNGWIHLTCIRPPRKTVPKYEWYCKDCKKNK